MKMPVVITYVRTPDNGQELRYCLRSLNNISNWNGEAYVVGDSEKWLKDVKHIRCKRMYGKPYADQANKVNEACLHDGMPDNFILMMDDVYITEPTEIGVYYRGDLSDFKGLSYYHRSKIATHKYLESNGYTTLDYECHAPIIINKHDYLSVYVHLIKTNHGEQLQLRSLYGNINQVHAELFEDKKTKTSTLKDGPILSTQFYTYELNKLFPNTSRFEQ